MQWLVKDMIRKVVVVKEVTERRIYRKRRYEGEERRSYVEERERDKGDGEKMGGRKIS